MNDSINDAQEIEIFRLTSGKKIKVKDKVIKEIPLTIFVNNIKIGTLLCTPSKLKYLALGFLLSQGIIGFNQKDKVKDIYLNPDKNFVKIKLDLPEEKIKTSHLEPHELSSCGACTFYDNFKTRFLMVPDLGFQIDRKTLFSQMEEFEKKSALFKITGGNHSCALCNKNGIEILTEDIGRHNALDKLLGWCFLEKKDVKDGFILLSGRISWEIVDKASLASVPLIASPSAPTDLAISLANKLNLTLVGFLREKRMNIYTHPRRVT